MRFGMDGATPIEVRRNNNDVVKIDPPLELADGDNVTLSLGYDVKDSYYDGELRGDEPPDGDRIDDWYCDEHTGNAQSPCVAFRGFFPSVTRTAR